jgi:hypothetical protein
MNIPHQRIAVNEIEIDDDHVEAADRPEDELDADDQAEPFMEGSRK